MNFEDVAKVVVLLLAALGGGGAVVAGLANWLGKLWADRLIENMKAQHNKEIEDFKATLQRQSDRSAQTFREKLALYKEVAGPILDLIIEAQTKPVLGIGDLRAFERKRLDTTVLLGMFAPQVVFEAYNTMLDYVFECLERKRDFTFTEFRKLGLRFVSEMRRDIGLYTDDVTYNGPR